MKSFLITLVLFMALFPLIGNAGGIGWEGCRSSSKTFKCGKIAGEEAIACSLQEMLQLKPSVSCLATLCEAGSKGCCACMHFQDQCNASRESVPGITDCIEALKYLILNKKI